MRRILFLIFFVFVLIVISLIGYIEATSANNEKFSEERAISMVIKDHPEFPSNKADTITNKLPIGGKSDTTVDVKFKTSIEKSLGDVYNVTLTKDWGITVNGTYVKSFWKYKVTPDNVVIVEKVDNEHLPSIIK